MLMGLLVFKKKYSLAKYVCVIMVTLGIALFMVCSTTIVFHYFTSSHMLQMPTSHKPGGTTTTSFGIALLLGSLALDGLTGLY